MADRDDGAGEGVESRFEVLAALDVEVIQRLVEEQQVAAARRQPRELESASLARDLAQQGRLAGAIRTDDGNALAALKVERRVGERLGKVADGLSGWRENDHAGIRHVLAGEAAQEGGLTGAVWANQPDVLAVVQGKADVGKHDVDAKRLGKIANLKYGISSSSA
ncbi:MAG: hypothetical protein ACRDIY_17925 [Chloroflexota bacterium]